MTTTPSESLSDPEVVPAGSPDDAAEPDTESDPQTDPDTEGPSSV